MYSAFSRLRLFHSASASRRAWVSAFMGKRYEDVRSEAGTLRAAGRGIEKPKVRQPRGALQRSAELRRVVVLSSVVVIGVLAVALMLSAFEIFSFGPLSVYQNGFEYAAGVITDQGVTMVVDDPVTFLLIVPLCGALVAILAFSAYLAGRVRPERAASYARTSGHIVVFLGALMSVASLLALTTMVPPSAAFFYMGYYAQIVPAAGIFVELLLGPLAALAGYAMTKSWGVQARPSARKK